MPGEAAKKRRHLINNARKRGLAMSLTLADVEALLATPKCYRCKHAFDEDHKLSVDRLDATVGYHAFNVRAMCVRCNNDKGKTTDARNHAVTRLTREVKALVAFRSFNRAARGRNGA